MKDTRRVGRPECDEVLNELEELKSGGVTEAEAFDALTVDGSQHAAACADCRAAIEDFATARSTLASIKASLPTPGPWFAARVMAAVRAAESEFEERTESVWASVRGLAPRLAAFAALLLVLGGTWAMELRRREVASGQAQLRPAEGLFESAPNTP